MDIGTISLVLLISMLVLLAFSLFGLRARPVKHPRATHVRVDDRLRHHICTAVYIYGDPTRT